VIRKKRIESSSASFAVAEMTWDDETGEAERVEYDADGNAVRRAVVRRFPRERWEDDVVGETTWFDADDRELERTPVLLGRTLL
jgi:hypothetical protein